MFPLRMAAWRVSRRRSLLTAAGGWWPRQWGLCRGRKLKRTSRRLWAAEETRNANFVRSDLAGGEPGSGAAAAMADDKAPAGRSVFVSGAGFRHGWEGRGD